MILTGKFKKLSVNLAFTCIFHRKTLIVLALISTFACTKKADDSKLFVFHGFEKDDVRTWDPANAYDSVSLDLVPSIYETLYQYSYLSELYKPEPLLAAAMPKYSKDKLTLTIPIKHGVKFQDDPCFKESRGKGRELKAQDFIYGLKRLALPSLQSQGWWILDGKIVGINAFHEKLLNAPKKDIPKIFEENVEGLKAIDDYTLQLRLNKPYPELGYILTMSFTSPVPKEAIDKYADRQGNLLSHPVGTGPFRLKKWTRNHQIILERNTGFRPEFYPPQGSEKFGQMGMLADAGKQMPFLDKIYIDIIKEDQPRWLNFMKGNIDTISLPKDNFRQAITNQVNLVPELVERGIRLGIETGIVIRYISFNMKDKLVGSNKYLRQALSSAIDREKWTSIFTNGTGKKMVNSIPPGIANRPKRNKIKYDFNISFAKELLKKAGYPGGEGLPEIKFDLRGASTTDRQLGDFIVQQWNQIGVKVDIIPNTFPAYLEKQKEGNLMVSFGGWSMDYPDAENIYQLLYGPNQSPGPAEANYDNPDVNKLYEQMAVLEPSLERTKIIDKIEEIVQEDCPWAWGYYEASYDLAQPWFVNYRSSDIIVNKYKYYRVNKALKKRYLGD